jgi:hypothetical protein
MRLAGRVTSKGRREVNKGFWWENLLEDLRVDGRVIVKWIFKWWDGAWNESIWRRIGTDGGLF